MFFAGLMAFLIGVATGMRALTGITAVSWAAHVHWIHLDNTWMAFLSNPSTTYALTFMAAGELVTDKLPTTPSRKIPIAFGGRIANGAVAGIALGTAAGFACTGLVMGILGAVAGTLGGAKMRSRLAKVMGKDFPAAVIEDMVAIRIAIAVVMQFAA